MIAMYLRKSRAEEGQSTDEVLSKHKAALYELADRLGLHVNNIYEEVASGEKLYARPEMLKLLEKIRSGDVESVLCMDIDRLGRGGMADQGTIFDAFRDAGTLIITPEKSYDLTNDVDIEMTEFKAFFARAEWRAIRKRMRRGLMQTIEAGGYTANAPYGYRQCRIGKLPSLEIIDEEAKFVRHMYSRYLSGVGAQTIAVELNEMGSKPRRSAQWSRSGVRMALRNPTYAGKVAWNRVKHFRPGAHGKDKHHVVYMPESEWILVDGAHEAIIPYETWLLVQQRRKERYVPPNNTGKRANPFAGLIYCSECGHHMQLMTHCGKYNEPYLLCNTKGCCAGTKFVFVEEAMKEALESALSDLKIKIAANTGPDVSALQAGLDAIERDIVKLNNRLPRLYEFLEDGTYDKATFSARRATLEAELDDLHIRKNMLTAKIADVESHDLKKAADDLQTFLALYPELDAGEKNIILKSLVDKVVYTKYKKTKPRDFSLDLHLKVF